MKNLGQFWCTLLYKKVGLVYVIVKIKSISPSETITDVMKETKPVTERSNI